MDVVEGSFGVGGKCPVFLCMILSIVGCTVGGISWPYMILINSIIKKAKGVEFAYVQVQNSPITPQRVRIGSIFFNYDVMCDSPV